MVAHAKLGARRFAADWGQCPGQIGNTAISGFASITVSGFTYRSAGLAEREALTPALQSVYERTHHLATEGREAVLLVTCNRTEVIGLGDWPIEALDEAAASAGLIERLRGLTYVHTGEMALMHLFRVISGLDSAVLGEHEIVSQVKHAWSDANRRGNVGPVLRSVLDRALIANKAVRRSAGFGRGRTSVASVAVEFARRRMGSLEGKRTVLVGAGNMAGLCAKYLSKAPGARLTIVNRTLERAQALASRFKAEALPMSELASCLSNAEFAIFAVSNSGCLVTANEIEPRQWPLLVLDLSIPRSVDPKLCAREGFELFDLSEITDACAANSDARRVAAESAEVVVQEQVREAAAYLKGRQAHEMIAALVDRAEGVRHVSLDRMRPKLQGLTSDELQAVEELTRRIMMGLLEAPIADLRASAGCHLKSMVVSRLFGLDGEAEKEELK